MFVIHGTTAFLCVLVINMGFELIFENECIAVKNVNDIFSNISMKEQNILLMYTL